MPSFGKTSPLSKEHFEEFERSFEKREEKETLERWTLVSMEDIVKKEYSLDLGLIKDESVFDSEDLREPVLTAQASIDKLEEAVDLLKSVIHELTLCEQE